MDRRRFLSLLGGAPAAWASAPVFAQVPEQGIVRLGRDGLYLPFLAQQRAEGRTLSQALATIGDEPGAFAEAYASTPRPTAVDVALMDAIAVAEPQDALDVIARHAKGRRLVILNEAHDVSRCRAFAAEVALRLRGEGFDLFAAETFSVDYAAERLNSGQPVTTGVGWYTDDPVFAELVRVARDAGYRFGEYEWTPDRAALAGVEMKAQIVVREEEQASNLAGLLKANPRSRMLVYCGYAHLMEAPDRGGNSWMATRLKAKTGIDPLTIDQSTTSPPVVRQQETPELAVALDRAVGVRSIVLRKADGTYLTSRAYEGRADMTVIHPRIPAVDGRPGWLAHAPGRRRAAFRLPHATTEYSLIQAAPVSEAANIVPADHYPVGAGVRDAVFFLRPGDYQVRVETAKGREIVGPLSVA
jgi:hypothetical protein